ncbi:MAG: hypothetical protein GXW99_11320 [Clostridiales bacterium]|nr:hypothetical protein [Clostridiales bacterium]
MATIAETVHKEAKNIKREILFMDIALMILGIMMMFFPEQSRDIICRVSGAILCLWGLLHVITYFARERTEVLGSFSLVQGAAMIGFGTYFLLRPEFLAAFLTVALAIILMIGGVMKLQYAIDFLRLKAYGWWVQLIGAAIMAVLGIVAFVDPFDAASGLMIFIGAALVVDGLWDMISVIYLDGVVKKVRQTRKDAVNEVTAIPVEPVEPETDTPDTPEKP